MSKIHKTKNAVITGASKGIGRATALAFAAQGYDLALCARSLSLLQELKKEIEELYHSKVYIEDCDLTDKQSVYRFALNALTFLGKIDVLVNNAGTFIPGGILSEDEGVYEQQMALNLSSVYYMCRKIGPEMAKIQSGHIINICSTASITAYVNGGSYCISKFGELGLTKVLREELKDKNVKVTAVLPGATLTDSWQGTTLPPERFMSPSHVATIIVQIVNSQPDIVHEEVIIRPQLGDIN